MLKLLLNRLGIEASEYLVKNTNKAREPFLEDGYSLLRVGCAVDKWSSEFPELIIKNKDKKRLKRFKSKRIISAYKKALLKDADYYDLRKCRFNYYEECALKELFGEEIKKEILDTYSELRLTKDRKSFLRG